jgi:hypothetical protein
MIHKGNLHSSIVKISTAMKKEMILQFYLYSTFFKEKIFRRCLDLTRFNIFTVLLAAMLAANPPLGLSKRGCIFHTTVRSYGDFQALRLEFLYHRFK